MTAPASLDAELVVRFEAANGVVREVDVADGRIIAERSRRTTSAVRVLELHIPRPVDPADASRMPFAEDPDLHGAVLVGPGSEGAGVSRLFPLAIGTTVVPTLAPRLATLWILHDGPFGRFAWANMFLGGECLANETASPDAYSGTDWDVVAELDYADCVRFYQGELEMRDLIARGHVNASVGALSALSWHVERPEMTAHADRYRVHVDRLLQWTAVVRSDEVLAGTRALVVP